MTITLSFEKKHFFMIGLLILSLYTINFVIAATGSMPINPGHPLSEIWVDTDLNMQGLKLTNIASPISSTDVATKGYVDSSAWNECIGVSDSNVGTPGICPDMSYTRVAFVPYSYDSRCGQNVDWGISPVWGGHWKLTKTLCTSSISYGSSSYCGVLSYNGIEQTREANCGDGGTVSAFSSYSICCK